MRAKYSTAFVFLPLNSAENVLLQGTQIFFFLFFVSLAKNGCPNSASRVVDMYFMTSFACSCNTYVYK